MKPRYAVGELFKRLRFRFCRKSDQTWRSAHSGIGKSLGFPAARLSEEALASEDMVVTDVLGAAAAGVCVVPCGGADFAGVQSLRGAAAAGVSR